MRPNPSRSVLITAATLIVLLFSAVFAVPAYADDSPPPPTDPPAEGTPPANVAAPDESAAQIVAQAPEGTPVVVVNEEGEVIPLATEEAAEVIASGDPMWCPAGVTPGAASCTASFASFNGMGLLAAINNKTVAGVIWVENSYSSAESGIAIDLSPGSVGTTASHALTINGGWTGAGTGISGISTFTVPLLITGWTGTVTLNNLAISGASITAGADNQALSVVTNGNILLNNVTVQNNTNPGAGVMNGAKLDNISSSAAATVTIKNSAFDQNEGKGLEVYSDGTVTINNLSANGNLGGDGAYIDNRTASTDKAVTLSGVQQFNDNFGYGLEIFSDGAIGLANVVADNNTNGGGAYLSNTTSAGSPGLTIKGVSQFNNNDYFGLYVQAHGVMTLNSITANDNGYAGAILDNAVTAPLPKAVNLTGTNTFNGNGSGGGWSGLTIYSLGAITLNNLTASNNSSGGNDRGAFLSNAFPSSTGGITIKGYGRFEDNGLEGSNITTNGVVLLNNIIASGNGAEGVFIDNRSGPADKAVTISGTQQFSNNTATGLRILSDGAITLAGLFAEGNASNGVWLDNKGSLGSLGVTIKGVNQSGNNAGTGLVVQSHGVIAINSLSMISNGLTGAFLDNASGVTIPKAVTLTGTNNFNSNGTSGLATGLYILSHGAITLNNVTASNNSAGGNDGGVFLDNAEPLAAGGVTIKGYGTFENNGTYGLRIFSSGAVLLNNINANDNGHGAVIDNCDVDFLLGSQMSCIYAGKPLTLKGTSNFSDNTSYGLEALSGGVISAANLTANRNGSGISFYSGDAEAPTIGNALLGSRAGVTLSGVNAFSKNTAGGTFAGGLAVLAYGPISLSNVTAFDNLGHGVYIRNDFLDTTPWNVTFTGFQQFNDNSGYGLFLNTYGAVLLNSVTASDNMVGGLYVDGSGGLAALPKPITLNGFNSFNNNGGSGLTLYTLGVITLNNITADGNGGSGAAMQNDLFVPASASSPGVFIKGYNSFSNNSGLGVTIGSKGVITLNNINADNNGAHGAFLANSTGISKAVKITGVNNFNGNVLSGLHIEASGAVSLSRITANNNDPTNLPSHYGIFVDTPGNITLTCGYTYNNGYGGVYLQSSAGSVTIKGIYSFSNDTSNIAISSFVPAPPIVYPCALP